MSRKVQVCTPSTRTGNHDRALIQAVCCRILSQQGTNAGQGNRQHNGSKSIKWTEPPAQASVCCWRPDPAAPISPQIAQARLHQSSWAPMKLPNSRLLTFCMSFATTPRPTHICKLSPRESSPTRSVYGWLPPIEIKTGEPVKQIEPVYSIHVDTDAPRGTACPDLIFPI
jgi:hypothetical protein